ncbi:MAG: mechanosensitive ion channel family protein [Saprospiraceae bacterium]|nr:mechanosensitive ion channel family protein [Saprospiraceae bacterium]
MRLGLQVTMPYAESFSNVKKVIEDCLKDFSHIMEEPAPLIGIESFDFHNIIISVRPYIHPDNYWDANFESLQRIKKALHEENIQVAYSEEIELGKVGS